MTQTNSMDAGPQQLLVCDNDPVRDREETGELRAREGLSHELFSGDGWFTVAWCTVEGSLD